MITFDFSKKRVRLNGKVLSKFDIADYFDTVQPSLCWRISYDVFSYLELACRFMDYLLRYPVKCESLLGSSFTVKI